MAAESETLANLEASVTFTVDGKELAWRDLNRLLVSEKSAVKRRALWNGAHAAALQLDAAVARRDEKARAVLAELGLPPPLTFAAQTRGLQLDALGALAEAELARTEQDWRVTLEALSEADVRLPLSALTRAELPRLLKVPALVDAEFPKAKIAARAGADPGHPGRVRPARPHPRPRGVGEEEPPAPHRGPCARRRAGQRQARRRAARSTSGAGRAGRGAHPRHGRLPAASRSIAWAAPPKPWPAASSSPSWCSKTRGWPSRRWATAPR